MSASDGDGQHEDEDGEKNKHRSVVSLSATKSPEKNENLSADLHL